MGISLHLLGAPRIERDRQLVHVDTRKALALIAYLVVQGSYQSRDTLSALLWADNDNVSGRGALRRTLSALNSALGGSGLSIEREAVAFDSNGLWCDLVLFNESILSCETHGHTSQESCSRCMQPLTTAIDAYKGDFLQGFTLRDSAEFDLWQFQQTEYFRRLYASALEKLVRLHSQREEYSRAIELAQRWLALDPLHEAAHVHLIQLYAWSGQRMLAMRQYKECVRVLDQELGVAPLDETARIYQRVLETAIQSRAMAAAGSDRKTKEQGQAQAEPASLEHSLPMVGRDDEIRRLTAVYQQVRSGSTHMLVVLEGEAGIGKTRLADAFIRQRRADFAQVFKIRCYESESSVAYAPLIRSLYSSMRDGERLHSLADHWLAELSRLLPDILALRPGLSPAAVMDGAGAQTRLFESICHALLCLVQGEQPGILVFEDLQWADGATLDLLAYLMRRVTDDSLLLMLTWRKEDVPRSHRLRLLLAEHGRGIGQVITLQLRRLDRTAVHTLVKAAGIPNSEALTERLYQESEGLPLFLHEYLTLLRANTATVDEAEWSLPMGIQDLVRSRLTLLDETAQQILETSAVIGRSFDLDLVRECSGRSEEEAVDALDELLRLGVLSEAANTDPAHKHLTSKSASMIAYEFYHEKLRAVIYQDTSMARRRLLHRRVAQAILNRVRHTGRLPALAAQIAAHFYAGGQEREAAEYFVLAGRSARSMYANREALAHFETALALGSTNPDVHREIGDLYTLLGDYRAALRSYETGIARADERLMPRLEHALAGVYHRLGEWDTAENYYNSAYRRLPENGLVERAALLSDWSLTKYTRGDAQAAQGLAQTAMTIAEQTEVPRVKAQAHNILGILARKQEVFNLAVDHLSQSLRIAATLEDRGMHVAALNNLALTLSDSGEYARSEQLLREALELCLQQGDVHHAAALQNNLADLFHVTGQSEQAMIHLKAAVSFFAQVGLRGDPMKPDIWKLAEW
ncbi:MAG: AAA family ATPase [Pleurocapsa minor GSE-CHR-MK-17-07R]|jgi:predicted ATPase|nr:AAA family ATPase [Pleurocapsa minor GSE-CHR-MK 17-07R]